MKDGDANIAFFHHSTILKRWGNAISSLQITSGDQIDNQDETNCDILFNHCKQRWTLQQDVEDMSIPVKSFMLSEEQNSWLTKIVMVEEIQEVIHTLHNDKTLGPDGYSAYFFKHFWSLIKHDVILAF